MNYRLAAPPWIALSAVLALAARANGPSTQTEPREEDPRFRPAAESEAAERRGRIEAEVAQLGAKHAWAGSYYRGDGTGVNVSVWIAPQAGFVFAWHGCLGLYDRNYGSVRERQGRLELAFEFPNERKGFRGLDESFVPVAWGARRYLIASDQFTQFANWFNVGHEPRSGMWGMFLLRRGDEQVPVTGKPEVPEQYAAMFLDQPIEARVVEIVGSRVERRGETDYRITTVKLDVGTQHGAFDGMELYPLEPHRGDSFELVELGATDSTAECSDYGADGPQPEIGWKLATRR